MQAFSRLFDLVRSKTGLLRTRVFLDATKFNRDYVVAMVEHQISEGYPGRVDAQLTLLMESVWAAEKMWRLEDRIEGAIRGGGRHHQADPTLLIRTRRVR